MLRISSTIVSQNGKFKSVDELKKGFWYWCKNDRKVKKSMSQWISRLPIPKIYLSFLLLWLYYAIFSASFLALLGFVFFSALPLFSISMEDCGQGSLCLWSFWKLVYISKMATRKQRVKHLVDSV